MYGVCLMLSMLYLFMRGLGRGGEQGARVRNHWSMSQCLCLCLGFPLSFSLVPTTASSFKFLTTPLSIFTFLPVYLTLYFSRIQFKSVPAEPALPSISLHPAFSLYTCQPLLSCLCLCSSLALGMVCLDAKEEENLSGGAQLGGAPRLGRKSACGTGCKIFRRNAETQTSVQALSGRSLLQMHILCNNTCSEYYPVKACVKCGEFTSCFDSCTLFLCVHAFMWLWLNWIGSSGFTCQQDTVFKKKVSDNFPVQTH